MADAEDLPTPHDYRMALLSQTACNLSGIVYTFAKVLHRIWNEANKNGGGTDAVNRHVISRLYSEQIAHLSGAGCTSDYKSWEEAMKICEERAKEVPCQGS